MTEIRGVCPVLPTLFDDTEQIHFTEMRGLIEALIAMGIHGLTMFGVGSEFYKLSEEERTGLLRFFLDAVNRRVVTIVSVTAHSTLHAIRQACEAAEAGAEALMLLPPFFAHPDAGSVLIHIQEVAGKAGIPVIIQYAPEETGMSIPVDVFLKIAEGAKGNLYVKVESRPAGPLVSRLSAGGLNVLVGKGGIPFFEALERGAVGVMPGCSLAGRFVAMYERYTRGDHDEAFQLHNRLIPYLTFVDQSTELFLASEKYFLKKEGLITADRCRRPGFQLQNVHRQVLDRYHEMLRT